MAISDGFNDARVRARCHLQAMPHVDRNDQTARTRSPSGMPGPVSETCSTEPSAEREHPYRNLAALRRIPSRIVNEVTSQRANRRNITAHSRLAFSLQLQLNPRATEQTHAYPQ